MIKGYYMYLSRRNYSSLKTVVRAISKKNRQFKRYR